MVGVAVQVAVAVGVSVGVYVAVGVLVGVYVAVGVLVGVCVAVRVLVGVQVAINVSFLVGVGDVHPLHVKNRVLLSMTVLSSFWGNSPDLTLTETFQVKTPVSQRSA